MRPETLMKICTHCNTEFADPNAMFCGRDGQPLVEAPDPGPQPPGATANVGTPFSGSLAMALFANHFIEQKAPPRGGTSPCRPDVTVSTVQLYYELPIISLWYLRENNFIRFVQTTSQHRHSPLGLEAIQANHQSVPGLEYDYWEIIKGCAPGTPVHAVVRQLFGEKAFYPESKLHLRIREWMIHLGYGQTDPIRKPFFQLNDPDTRIFTFLPDCERIMAQQQTAQMIQRAWTKFFWEERAIYQYLFQDVVSAGADATAGSRKPSMYWHTADDEYRARLQRLQAGPGQTPGQQ